jgi:hypothetical protein
VEAPQPVVVGTLRDYDHLSEFVPTVVLSRRITYQGQPAIEQIGRARFLLFSFRARTILREWNDPASGRLMLDAVAGDFSTYESTWTFHPAPAGTRVVLSSQVVMKRWVPQWLARRELKKNVRVSLEALIAEMERRARTHGEGP